jgi:hypothetical protein
MGPIPSDLSPSWPVVSAFGILYPGVVGRIGFGSVVLTYGTATDFLRAHNLRFTAFHPQHAFVYRASHAVYCCRILVTPHAGRSLFLCHTQSWAPTQRASPTRMEHIYLCFPLALGMHLTRMA